MAISFTAGQLVTANALSLLAPLFAVKAANQSVVNSTTQVNDNDIVFTLVANQTVHVQANLSYQMTVTNFGIQCSWATTGTLTLLAREAIGASPNGSAGTPTAITISQAVGGLSFASTAIYAGTTINSTYNAREELVFTTGASGGTLQLKWANGFTGTDTSTMMAGTNAIARYVA